MAGERRASRVWAVARKPAGGRTIESPWLIQTELVALEAGEQSAALASSVIVAGPYSRFAAGTTSPPSSRAMSWRP